MKKFISLSANKYKFKKGIEPVTLSWENNTIADWCTKVKINKEDVIIGHSIGAAISLIVAEKNPPKKLHLYSPSLIFTETIGLLDEIDLKYLGKKRLSEVKSIPNIKCPVTIHVGSMEDRVMIEGAKIIAKHLGVELDIVLGADHITVINKFLVGK
jgi:predicted alpha/beta hydrolase family esterase